VNTALIKIRAGICQRNTATGHRSGPERKAWTTTSNRGGSHGIVAQMPL